MKTMPKAADLDLGDEFVEETIAEQEARMQALRDANLDLAIANAPNPVLTKVADIRATLDERARTHGDYNGHAAVTQMLKQIMRAAPKWGELKYHEQETLEMVAHKISRILTGDPHFHDHWHDIAGYATLSADRNK